MSSLENPMLSGSLFPNTVLNDPRLGNELLLLVPAAPGPPSGIVPAVDGVLGTHGIPVRFLDGTRDIWARDYCPIQVAPDRFVKFRYFPDYLRGEHEDLVTDDDTICQQLDGLGHCQRSDIILDGGNVVATRSTAIVTDKVYRENAGRQRGQLRRELREALELTDCVLIPKEPYDPIGHADGVVRFLDEGSW